MKLWRINIETHNGKAVKYYYARSASHACRLLHEDATHAERRGMVAVYVIEAHHAPPSMLDTSVGGRHADTP